MSEDADAGPDEFPVKDGSLYGVFGYLGGHLMTLVVVFFAEGEGFPGDPIQGAGWVFYNAQFVDIVTRGAAGTQPINYVTESGLGSAPSGALSVPSILYHLLPIVAFVTAGFALVRDVGVPSPIVGAKVGASLVFGCIFVSIAGTFLFEVGGLGPSRPASLFFVGILYPALCGGVGGAVAAILD